MSSINVHAYLFFGGNCEEALAFYERALGAKTTMLLRVKDSPDPMPADIKPEGWDDKIMHAEFTIGNTCISASDGCKESAGQKMQNFALILNVPDGSTVDRFCEVLAEGGVVIMPPGKTFWSERFGMVEDKFGLRWMIGVSAEM